MEKDERYALSIEIPYSMGYANPKNNAGKMSTTGFDLEISWNDRINDLVMVFLQTCQISSRK